MSAFTGLDKVRSYYENRLALFGATPRGVDWNSVESQELRFQQLLKICEEDQDFRLGDYGCGYGGLFDYFTKHGLKGRYYGFDISEQMIAAASQSHQGRPDCAFATTEEVLAGVDYLVASGIFNVKLDSAAEDWEHYILRTLERFVALSRRGFAFNVLTRYSDKDRMRGDLYYADPCFLFDHCKRTISRHVALLHDYGLYEFTILVRLEGGMVSRPNEKLRI
jgi:SAM-dependent methyltransferase